MESYRPLINGHVNASTVEQPRSAGTQSRSIQGNTIRHRGTATSNHRENIHIHSHTLWAEAVLTIEI